MLLKVVDPPDCLWQSDLQATAELGPQRQAGCRQYYFWLTSWAVKNNRTTRRSSPLSCTRLTSILVLRSHPNPSPTTSQLSESLQWAVTLARKNALSWWSFGLRCQPPRHPTQVTVWMWHLIHVRSGSSSVHWISGGRCQETRWFPIPSTSLLHAERSQSCFFPYSPNLLPLWQSSLGPCLSTQREGVQALQKERLLQRQGVLC